MFGALIIFKKSKNILNLEKVYSVCSAHRDMLKRMWAFSWRQVCGLVCRKDEKTMLPVLEGPAAESTEKQSPRPCKGLKRLTDNWRVFSQSGKLMKTRREPDFSVTSIDKLESEDNSTSSKTGPLVILYFLCFLPFEGPHMKFKHTQIQLLPLSLLKT